MAQLSEHPTVKQFRAKDATDAAASRPESLGREWFRQVCLAAGADDSPSLLLAFARCFPS